MGAWGFVSLAYGIVWGAIIVYLFFLKRRYAAAVLGIIGFLDIPLIHMSVYWWRTLHQPPSILRPDKAPWENVHPAMLTALAISFVGFLLLYFYLLSMRYRLGEMREEIRARRLDRGA